MLTASNIDEQEARKSDKYFYPCCRIHAPGEIAGASSGHPLGLLPHQMRGSLSQYNLLTLMGYSSSNCTACSNVVCKLSTVAQHACYMLTPSIILLVTLVMQVLRPSILVIQVLRPSQIACHFSFVLSQTSLILY